MTLHILLPVHNRKSTTQRFIESLISQTFKDYNLILIDDGSTDGTAEMVNQYLPNTVVLYGKGDLWWAGALQKGYEWLITNAKDDDYCLVVNDDTVFNERFLEQGIEILNGSDRTLLLSQCYSQQTGLLLDNGVHVDWKKLSFDQAKSKEEINCLSTRGLFLRISNFKAIGGFYPRTLPHYLSDYEFTIRAFRKGYKLITDDTLKLYVDQETTGIHTISAKNIRDYLLKYFSNRNSSNPIHWIVFLWLSCPNPWKIYHIIRVIYRTVKEISKFLFKESR
jgi:GT2 family glycosyltransferase